MFFKNEDRFGRDCAEQHRIENEDGSCGECLDGYVENRFADCIQEIREDTLEKSLIIGMFVFTLLIAPVAFYDLFKDNKK
tara:strand:+ start:1251 stop:1490 length:240 start_codon:yes stop_codon:yes gene_type:complete